MRVLSPDAAGTGRTRTMTTRLVALRPSPTDLLDASFLLVLVLLGLLGLATSFDSARYLILGLLGTVLGLLLAHLSNVLRWHWTVPLLAAAAFYLVLGGALAVPDGLLAGFIPSLATFSAFSLCRWMRRSSVSSPLCTTHALNAAILGPVLRWNGSRTLLIHSADPQTAPAMTRPCPSIILVAE